MIYEYYHSDITSISDCIVVLFQTSLTWKLMFLQGRNPSNIAQHFKGPYDFSGIYPRWNEQIAPESGWLEYGNLANFQGLLLLILSSVYILQQTNMHMENHHF